MKVTQYHLATALACSLASCVPSADLASDASFSDASSELSTPNATSDGSVPLGSTDAGATDSSLAPRLPRLVAGTDNACATAFDGKVFCWGNHTHGELGWWTGAPSPVAAPREIGTLRGQAVSMPYALTCGLGPDHRVRCMGGGSTLVFGGDPNAMVTTPTVIPTLDGAASLVSRGNGLCVINAADRVVCVRTSHGSQPAPPTAETVGTFAAFENGGAGWCGIDASGAVWCLVSARDRDLLGLGPDVPATDLPRRLVELPPIRDLSVGDHFACALDDGGRVWCWGDNRWGQTGSLRLESAQRPAVVELPARARSVRVTNWGSIHRAACALLDDARVFCWGVMLDRVLESPAPFSPVARAVSGLPPDVDEIALGSSCGVALSRDERVSCWGAGGCCMPDPAHPSATARELHMPTTWSIH